MRAPSDTARDLLVRALVWEGNATMSSSRSYLRELATNNADAWARTTPDSKFAGEMRIETRNTIYDFKDGACTGVARGDRAFRSDPTTLVGMRFLGWLWAAEPGAGLREAWEPGAYAVLWRARRANEPTSCVALTSAAIAFSAVRRRSTPPPLRPRPKSMTRMNSLPPAPPTPTPQTLPRSIHTPVAPTPARVSVAPAPPLPRRTVPPPLPKRAMPPPLPPRASVSGSHASA
jgi:hypothetical protein